VSRGALLRLALTALVAAALGAFTLRNLAVTTGITGFLSAPDEVALAGLSARIADSPLVRTMILSIAAPDPRAARRAAREWATDLAAHPEVASLRVGPGEDLAPAVYALYFPRRHLFLSARPESEIPARLSDAGLRALAAELRSRLLLPEAPLVRSVAGADPILAFPALIERFERERLGGLAVRDGHFVDREGLRALLFLTTRHSAFDGARQAELGRFLDRSFEALDRRLGGGLVLERSGAHRFAAAAEQRAREDVARISLVSVVAITAAFLALFRPSRLVAISSLPIGVGLLAATAGGLLCFGELHAITLAFGATLIGVCVDYPIHVIAHLAIAPAKRPALRHVRRAVVLGALTTVAGLAGLAGSEIAGIREIALFAAIGVLAALAATLALVPALSGDARPTRAALRLVDATARALRGPRSRAKLAVPAAALLLCAVGLPRVRFEDDVFRMSLPADPAWEREDARVRERVSRMDAGRFVVAIGADEEAALRRNDAVYERLEAARAAGALEGFRSLHALLWSEDLQRRNLEALRRVPELERRTLAALEREGFRPEAFAAFSPAAAEGAPEPLRLDELAASPLASMVSPFVVRLDDGVALLSFLQGVHDPEALAARLADLEGVHYFDQQRFLAELFGRHRARAMGLVAAGFAAVVALLVIRYRSPRLALAAALPAALAVGTTLAVLSLAGLGLGLLNVLGVLLVLGLGVDYAIFLVESRAEPMGVEAAMLSISLGCASTCLGFGLLALSAFPALRAIGLTIGVGVLLCLLLAPTALLLTDPRRAPP
jgi:predicted exporter